MYNNIHSLRNVFGRPVHQLINANIKSANLVAATKCIKGLYGQDVQLMFRTNVRMGKTCSK